MNLKDGSVKFVRFRPNQIELEVDAKRDALLVLAEAWYPGWYARLGENTISSVAASSWMRAFSLPAGKHCVVVFFRQNYLLLGALITLLSGGVLCLVLLRTRKSRAYIVATTPHCGATPAREIIQA
jgi:Predicted membrane protein